MNKLQLLNTLSLNIITDCKYPQKERVEINYSKYNQEGLLQVDDGIICPKCNKILRNNAIFNSHLSSVHNERCKVVKQNGMLYITDIINSPRSPIST